MDGVDEVDNRNPADALDKPDFAPVPDTVASTPAVVVEARGLWKRFGDLEAVKGIDFQVRRGEVFGFLGPNGAGKSTTMKMLYGFVEASAGELRVLGMDARNDLRTVKTRLGIVHQDNNLDPDLTCREILIAHSRFYGIGYKEALGRADELLGFFHLTEKADTIPRKLSGGMLRRLMMARALMNNPDLLILDEPTTGLDPQARHLLWLRLRELRRKGITILLTSHYMDEVEILCDRLVMINEGRIIAEGTPKELIRRFVGEEMFEVEVVEDELRGEVRRHLAGEGPAPRLVEEFGDRLYVGCEAAIHPQEWLKNFEPQPRWWRRPATLEDVFLRLSGRDLRE